MLSAIDDHLEDGEVIEASIHPSPLDISHLRWYLLTVILTAGIGVAYLYPSQVLSVLPDVNSRQELLYGLVFPVLLLASAEIHRRSMNYHLTDRKLVQETGVFNKRFLSMYYSNIAETRLQQPFYKRVFNLGDIFLDTAGQDSVEMELRGVPDPEEYKVMISSKTSVAHMPHESHVSAQNAGISANELDAELQRIQKYRGELEHSIDNGDISRQAYYREWYKLEGQENIIQHFLNRLGNDADD